MFVVCTATAEHPSLPKTLIGLRGSVKMGKILDRTYLFNDIRKTLGNVLSNYFSQACGQKNIFFCKWKPFHFIFLALTHTTRSSAGSTSALQHKWRTDKWLDVKATWKGRRWASLAGIRIRGKIQCLGRVMAA